MPISPTHAHIYRRALKDALGFPAFALFAGMAGFGSLARASGFSLGLTMASTAGIWGLPGQVALAELHGSELAVGFVILASSLANARFLPMAMAFMPLFRAGGVRLGWLLVFVQMMSINTWAVSLRVLPQLAAPLRPHYYLVFAPICMGAGLAGTAVGFYGGGLNHTVTLALIFLTPLFFAAIMAATPAPASRLAILIGAPLGPLLYLLSPDWGLLATGFGGGSIAFFIHYRRSRQ